MLYAKIVEAYEKIESTTKRLEMIDYLVELFKQTPEEIIDKVVYLTQGKVYPDFVGIELGMAEKLGLKALVVASGLKEEEIEKIWKKTGDLGVTAFEAVKKKMQTALFFTPLTAARVYNNFEKIAKAAGEGAQELKLKLIAELLHDSKPNEAKYIMRTVLGKMRIGIADMTILDALATAFAEKQVRNEIERAYNICSDLGLIAKTLAIDGIGGIKKFSIRLGTPIRMMLAERLSSIPEIIEKLGEAAYEYKYDGLRIQAHIILMSGANELFRNRRSLTSAPMRSQNTRSCRRQFRSKQKIVLFSRHVENISEQFPDVKDALLEAFKSEEGIVEGECVPVNINTGELLPFQEVSHRRGRKYGLKEAKEDYPVVFFLFDCLYANGSDLTKEPYLVRRKMLEKIISPTERVRISKTLITSDSAKIEYFFNKSIENGCEGLIAKSLGNGSFYRAGARGWQWIKYKREYKSEMVDTVDLVALGAFAGRGRRSGTYGALLMGTYNKEKDMFETVCKLGSGFDDATLLRLPEIFKDSLIQQKHPRINSEIKPDYWFVPKTVLEILGSEITLSPAHTCAYNKIRKSSGLAIRFPRFTGKWRDDKAPEDATTSQEIAEMYNKQLKKPE